MSALFSSDDSATAASAAATAAAEEERERAAAANLAATQEQLRVETGLRGQKNTIRSLLGSFGSGASLLGSG